jgi:hypothetical protein
VKENDVPPRRPHLVRPRLVWGGLGTALLGMAAIAVGRVLEVLPVTAVGLVALLAGAVAGVRGGVLYDAFRRSPARAELRGVASGGARAGVVPGDRVVSSDAARCAAAATRAARALEDERRAAPAPPLSPLAGWVLVLVTVVLVASQSQLVAHDATGRASSYRDTGLAILLGLAGLRLALGSGRHRLSSLVAAAAGLGLVAGGLWTGHHHPGLAAVEVACGTVSVLAALAAVGSRPTVRPPAPDTVAAVTRR